jgi:hypothetical protein
MPRLKRGMTTREVADRGLSLAKGCLAPAELSICLHPLGFVWPTVVLFISKHCFHYRFAGWLCSRKSWLRLRKTSKIGCAIQPRRPPADDGRNRLVSACICHRGLVADRRPNAHLTVPRTKPGAVIRAGLCPHFRRMPFYTWVPLQVKQNLSARSLSSRTVCVFLVRAGGQLDD